jgi:hypothetical protein
VVACTNSTIDFFAEPSFHDGSGSGAADCPQADVPIARVSKAQHDFQPDRFINSIVPSLDGCDRSSNASSPVPDYSTDCPAARKSAPMNRSVHP